MHVHCIVFQELNILLNVLLLKSHLNVMIHCTCIVIQKLHILPNNVVIQRVTQTLR